MALWKPFRGKHTTLDTVAKQDGYVYFCTDDGSLHFDYVDSDGNLQRKQISAAEAKALTGYDIATVLNASEVEIPTSQAVSTALGERIKVADIIDDLTTNNADKPLSAAQGVVLKALIDNISTDVPTDFELIAVADIDAICGTTIASVSLDDEVTF